MFRQLVIWGFQVATGVVDVERAVDFRLANFKPAGAVRRSVWDKLRQIAGEESTSAATVWLLKEGKGETRTEE